MNERLGSNIKLPTSLISLFRLNKGIKIHDVLPTYWDLEKLPGASNFCMGGGNNLFRLNAKYKSTLNPFVGSKKNVDLSPIEDKQAILDLMKIAEKIYLPGTIDKK